MEKVTRGLPESPAWRAARVARVGARYGFGFVFGSRFRPRRRREEPGRVGARLRGAFEDLGPTFAELGRFLSARRDLLPQDVADELQLATVAVHPPGHMGRCSPARGRPSWCCPAQGWAGIPGRGPGSGFFGGGGREPGS